MKVIFFVFAAIVAVAVSDDLPDYFSAEDDLDFAESEPIKEALKSELAKKPQQSQTQKPQIQKPQQPQATQKPQQTQQPKKTQATQPFQKPQPPAANGKVCREDGYVADPQDRTKFYYCQKHNGVFLEYPFTCPAPLVYDTTIKICNWA